MRSPVARSIAAATLAFVVVAAHGQAAPREGTDYTLVRPVQPTDAPAGRVEVVEFFGYWCPACNGFEPALHDWADRHAAKVRMSYVPVPTHFRAGEANFQKLFYALEALGREAALRPRIFAAIHQQRTLRDTADAATIADWVAANGVDRKTFVATFDSFGVQSKVRRADQLASAYGMTSTPSLGIGGRYLLALDAPRIGYADALLDRVLAGH